CYVWSLRQDCVPRAVDWGTGGLGWIYACVFSLFLHGLLRDSSSRALLCLPCDLSKCEEPKHCTGAVVPGICGCCSVCAKQRNESCGGVYGLYGTCDLGLRCVIRPALNGGSITQYEVGVCEDENWEDDQLLGFEPCNENLLTGCNIIDGKCVCDNVRTCNNPFEFASQEACQTALKRIEEEKPDCSKARCEVQFSPRCPEDSVLIEGYAPPGECCPLPSRCVCSTAGCLRKVCQPGYLNILVSKGSGKPGECCDLYECKPVFSVDCSTVECPLVQPLQCPADSYETQVRLTADGCCTLPTRCECLPSACTFPQCSEGMSPLLVSRGNGTPGKCCDVFECANETKPACTFDGVEYHDGDVFRMDVCHFCRCQGGVSVCLTAQCGALRCERYYVPEGECCPVCEDPVFPMLNFAGCYVNGQILAHGDHWREDDCTFCQCVSGEPRCVAAACGHSCLNPIIVPGECCPVCEEPTYITMAPPACDTLENCTLTERDCTYGFRTDADGCRACGCRTREELCHRLISGCTLDCPLGFQTDAHGCAVCRCRQRHRKCKPAACAKDCPFGFVKNKHGCNTCRCKKCPTLPCDKPCPMGFQQDELGCLVCQCRGNSSSVGPSIKTASCFSMDGRRHESGQSWHDGCRECYCHAGREMCALISCPVPVCDSPGIHAGQCCPTCPEEPGSHKPELSEASVCLAPGGEYFMEGETWNIDSCTQCTCHGGHVLCETEVCPPLLCQSPIRTQDSCCPHCPPTATMETDLWNSPAYTQLVWKMTDRVCADATRCLAAAQGCRAAARVLLLQCTFLVSSWADATPRAVCHFSGRTYMDEERWDIDSCTHCYCLQGQTLCSTVSCPALTCHMPITLEGSCCPTCSELAPTNVPIEKTDQRGDKTRHQPAWPTHSENDIMPQFRGQHTSHALSRSLTLGPVTRSLHVSRKNRKQWITVPCYSTPTKPTCLNNQLVYVDCHKGTKVQVDSSQRMLRIADPDSRYSGYYSMQKHNNLQADNFYQTA
uniref:Cysteine-rich motor neuron 1 protein n=1 Tax=Electrophorus electricus TaxID=8005 RepID=A0A4W4HBX8_ELEEL